jgi:hypothetical protein
MSPIPSRNAYSSGRSTGIRVLKVLLLGPCVVQPRHKWLTRGNAGVSLITQGLYVLVFCSRYLDLFWVSPAVSYWNFVLKNFYIWSSIYIIFLMLRVYARTREREKAWHLGMYCLGGSIVGAPIVTLIFRGAQSLKSSEVTQPFVLSKEICS